MLVVSDMTTKRAKFIPTRQTIDAAELINLLKPLVVQYGQPRVILTDRGSIFTSKMMRDFASSIQSEWRTTTAYHPRSDGVTERLNRTMLALLRPHVNVPWPDMALDIERVYNSTPHSTTGFSPFYLDTGRHPDDFFIPFCIDDTIISKDFEQFARMQAHNLQLAFEAFQFASDTMLQYANRQGRRKSDIREGDFVLLNTRNLNPEHTGLQKISKLAPRFIGPYRVLSLNNTSAKLQLPPGVQLHPVFHVELLKRYRTPKSIATPIRPVLSDGTLGYSLERIVRRKKNKKGEYMYLIKWVGYSDNHNTWEPRMNLQDCIEVVKAFDEKLKCTSPKKRASRKKRM